MHPGTIAWIVGCVVFVCVAVGTLAPLGRWSPSTHAPPHTHATTDALGGHEKGDDTVVTLHTPSAHKPPFPVDAVFTWVDGMDARWRAQLAAARARFTRTQHHHLPAREPVAARVDELAYSLRLAAFLLPWLRTVFIVTQRPHTPPFLGALQTELHNRYGALAPRLRVVHHDEFFSPDVPLPTFNANVIERQLGRLPDLAEHFLYFNDDFFVGQPLHFTAFFSVNGDAIRTRYNPEDISATCRDKKMLQQLASAVDPYGRQTCNLVRECALQGLECYLLHHQVYPLKRSWLIELEAARREETASWLPLRAGDEWNALFLLMNMHANVPLPPAIRSNYYATGNEFVRAASKAAARWPAGAPHLFCINDKFTPAAAKRLDALLAYWHITPPPPPPAIANTGKGASKLNG